MFGSIKMKLKEFKADLNPYSSRHNFSAHKNVLNRLLIGNLESDYRNRGMEFFDYRSYDKGNDDASRIDWKAALRARELLIRETVEEKSVNVIFLIDVSDSMLFSSGTKLKCEYAAELLCGMSFSIQRESNAIGLCLFNHGIVKNIPPKIGSTQFNQIMREVSNPSNYGGGCDIKIAIKQTLAMLNSPSLIILISDFINVGDDWNRFLEITSIKYDLFGINIKDVRDTQIPENIGYYTIEDPNNNERLVIDTKDYSKRYNYEFEKDKLKIDNYFKKAKSSCLTLLTNQDYFNPLIKFLQKRERII